mgnify:CR=1 FL=1
MNAYIKLFMPVSLATYLCIRYLDRPVSLFVNDCLYGNSHWSALTSSLPDILLLVVIIISIPCAFWHFYRKKRSLFDAKTSLLGFLALTLPIAFILKSILKYLFGRVETRYWLHHQQVYEFHWLHGGSKFNGFPSGHMIVLVTLFAAIARYCAGYRLPCYTLMALLALLLVSTNYHFVGDVIAGMYLGLLLESSLDRFYIRNYPGG